MTRWVAGIGAVLGLLVALTVFGLFRTGDDGRETEAQDSAPVTSTSPPTTAAAPPPPTTGTTAPTPQHYVLEQDTTFTERLVLRPGDTIELRNGSCLCFGPGGGADWRGTPTSTWSDDGRSQNLERDIEITGEGHIRFGVGAEPSEIRFVAIDLQPPQEVGKYPLHFHHAGNDVRGTIVEGVVVQNSTNRAFVAHASHGITFKDTIAKDVVGSAYWWDPPAAYSRDRSENSNDITYDHALADGVETFPGEPGYRLSAFFLGPGTGNVIVNSAAMNVGGRKDSSGFHWPGRHHSQPLTWRFENNVAHDNVANGLFVWQNNQQEHVIDGYTGYANANADIDHGAYQNGYDYRNVDIDTMQIHALGWSVTGGSIGTVTTLRHANEGNPVTFTDVAIDRLIINNTANNGDAPGEYIFTDTGLTFADIVIEGVVTGTQVTIDGETHTY